MVLLNMNLKLKPQVKASLSVPCRN